MADAARATDLNLTIYSMFAYGMDDTDERKFFFFFSIIIDCVSQALLMTHSELATRLESAREIRR